MTKPQSEYRTILNAQVTCHRDGGIVKLKLESSPTECEATVDVESII